MEETEREEIFHGQGSVSKVIFRSDEAAVPALGAVAAGGGPAACGAGRLYRGPGGRVLRGAAAGRFDGDDLPQHLPHRAGAEDGLSVFRVPQGARLARARRHGVDVSVDLPVVADPGRRHRLRRHPGV